MSSGVFGETGEDARVPRHDRRCGKRHKLSNGRRPASGSYGCVKRPFAARYLPRQLSVAANRREPEKKKSGRNVVRAHTLAAASSRREQLDTRRCEKRHKLSNGRRPTGGSYGCVKRPFAARYLPRQLSVAANRRENRTKKPEPRRADFIRARTSTAPSNARATSAAGESASPTWTRTSPSAPASALARAAPAGPAISAGGSRFAARLANLSVRTRSRSRSRRSFSRSFSFSFSFSSRFRALRASASAASAAARMESAADLNTSSSAAASPAPRAAIRLDLDFVSDSDSVASDSDLAASRASAAGVASRLPRRSFAAARPATGRGFSASWVGPAAAPVRSGGFAFDGGASAGDAASGTDGDGKGKGASASREK